MTSRLDELDRLSRQRELSKAESFELEREVCRSDGRRTSYGLTKALARAGVKRSGRRVSSPLSSPPAPQEHRP